MSIMKDSRRKIYISKETPFDAERALIIPLGDNFLVVPIPDKPIELEIEECIEELKKKAEKPARLDYLRRVPRT